MPEKIKTNPETITHKKYEVESPYLAEEFREETEDYQYEEIKTRYSRGRYHVVIETMSGKKFVEKYPEGDEPTIYETQDFLNEFFESELLKAALANGIINKEEIVVPSIKLQLSQGDHAYYSEFISDIWDPISPPELEIHEKFTEEFRKITEEFRKRRIRNYKNFEDLLHKEQNAAPLAILHLITGDKDRVFSNYKLKMQKDEDTEKCKLVVLDMAGGGQRRIGSAIGTVLLKSIKEEQVLPYLKNIKEFVTQELVNAIIEKIPMPQEMKDKKRQEVMQNLANIELLLDEEFRSLREEKTAENKEKDNFKTIKIDTEKLTTENVGKKIIVEVGCGSRPYFIQQKESIKKNEYYIGIDLPETYIVEPKDEQERMDMPKQSSWFVREELKKNMRDNAELIEGKADFVIASGFHIPLKENSADSIVFSAVFGAPTPYFIGASFVKNVNDFNKFWEKPFIEKYIKQLTPEEKKWLEEQKDYYIKCIKEGSPMALSQMVWTVEYQIREKNKLREKHMMKFDDLFTRDAKERLLDEALRVLKINGELVIFDHEREWYNGSSIGMTEIEKRFQFIKKEIIRKSKHDEDFKLVFKKV